MKKANKHKTILIIGIALVLFSEAFVGAFILFTQWRDGNAKWLHMKSQIVQDNSVVKNIYRIDSGSHCDIMIDLNAYASYEQVDAIQHDINSQLKNKETLQEITTYHKAHASGDLDSIKIYILNAGDDVYLLSYVASKKDDYDMWHCDIIVDHNNNEMEGCTSDFEPK